MIKVLYYPQISSISNGVCLLNTEATFLIMLTFIKCINETYHNYEWIFVVPEKNKFEGEIPDNVKMIPISLYPDSKIGRYDFNAQAIDAIIKEYKPDVIINNNPTLSRNIRILAPNTPIIQKNDFQGHGLPENINYRIRQVDGVISSDIAFEITQANKDLFIRYAAKEFNSKVINMLKKKIKVIRQGVYTREMKEMQKKIFFKEYFIGETVVFPGRIGTTNYNHWQNMVDIIISGAFDKTDRDRFYFVFTNPTKEKGKAILAKYLESKGHRIYEEHDYKEFTRITTDEMVDIYLFKYPDVREKYLELLTSCDIGVQMFDKDEEPHGGIACREMAWCNLKLVLSDTFKINGFVKGNYKYITNMTPKDLERKIRAISKEDGSKLVYNVETMEEGADILHDAILELTSKDGKE